MARNPAWSRDELILALDLYFGHSPLHISQTHAEVIKLSELLNQLPIHQDRPDETRFRNPNGVNMKLCNFLRFDPGYEGTGLQRGSRLEKEVWEDFFPNQQRLRSLASTIRAAVTGGFPSIQPEIDETESAPEGKVLLRIHKSRERSPSLVRKKKRWALQKYGRLECEVCGFEFKRVYGELGKGFIKCHHTKSVSQLRPGERTRLKDLALVCANCHRVLHRGGEGLSVSAELRPRRGSGTLGEIHRNLDIRKRWWQKCHKRSKVSPATRSPRSSD